MHYYNENEPSAAAWLKQLIADGHLPSGDVDDRSIEDVKPSDLDGYTQCHFFAGIGGWPLVLQLAGWPTDRPVWTGSCPCQPYSNAGAGAGTDDPRNLWWCYRWLIQQCRPPVVFGEQVASKAGREWLTGVQTDLQAMAYDTAGADLCAAGVGAPHIRQRLWWVGHAISEGPQVYREPGQKHAAQGRKDADGYSTETGMGGGMADSESERLEERMPGQDGSKQRRTYATGSSELDGGVADANSWQQSGQSGGEGSQLNGQASGREQGHGQPQHGSQGYWSGADLIPCADGKARRIEPGAQPLVDGIPRGVVPECDPSTPGYAQKTGEARKMRLHGYGNAIVPHVAAEFIVATCEVAA